MAFLFRILINFLVISVIANSAAVHCSANVPVVKLQHGDFNATLEGVEKRNLRNETFNAFLGIPYAKPPVGDLRFIDPQKLDKINGTFHAYHEGYECHSITAKNASEDCLNLNVYMKELTPNTPLPVVVVIHPGGLYLGSSKFLEPSYMMTKDIVLVTFNYRLGSLGYLNLGTSEVPGNAGFKDQVYALQWVNRYIHGFGGNPQDITLMGYSAGAMSVSLHLISPLSKGLFHKAIIMSGSLPPQVKVPPGEQKFLAVRQAKRLNCSRFEGLQEAHWHDGLMSSDYANVEDSDILECLQNITAIDISNTLRKMFDFGKDNPIYLWLPVQERDFGQATFLRQDYYQALQDLNKLEVPLLIGHTNGEFCTSAREILKDPHLITQFEKDFDKLAPRLFMYESQAHSQDITNEIRNFYFNGSKTVSGQDFDKLCDLFSDSIIRFGAHRLAKIAQAKGQVYFYEFRYQHKISKDELFPEKKDRVEHMDDLQYLFNWSGRDDLSLEELGVVELYTDFIYDFVKNGKITNPTAKPYPESHAVFDQNGVQFEDGDNFKNYKFWLELLLRN